MTMFVSLRRALTIVAGDEQREASTLSRQINRGNSKLPLALVVWHVPCSMNHAGTSR